MQNALVEFIQQFHFVSDTDKELLAQYFEVLTLKEGDKLFKGGKVCNELFFVANGVVRIHSYNDKGVNNTHYFYRENQFCTIRESFEKGIIGTPGIEACCDTVVYKITKTQLYEVYEKLPYLKGIIDSTIQEAIFEKIRIINSYQGQEAEDRYKKFLQQQPDVALRVPVKLVASFLGITRQSLSRIRRQIK